MPDQLKVGILGATGTVGQRFVQMLEHHPLFRLSAVAASGRSEDMPYAQACTWRLADEMPDSVKPLVIRAPRPPLDCDLVFSSLPAETAREAEESFARAGYPVISNSSAWRMEDDVPLLIPEVNHAHLRVLETQRVKRGFPAGGMLVTNPNCCAVMVALALAPLHARFGIAAAMVTTMQALSGAGYPGVASLDATDNVLPYIENEEEKIESETQKLLGRLDGTRVAPACFPLSAQCHRVNVSDGHMAAIRVKLARPGRLEEMRAAMASFTSLPQELRLPTAPERPIIVRDEPDRPQPRLDRQAGNGMSVTIGRILPDRVLDYRFVALSHNTIRGAAGAAILNAELLFAKGYFDSRTKRAI